MATITPMVTTIQRSADGFTRPEVPAQDAADQAPTAMDAPLVRTTLPRKKEENRRRAEAPPMQ